MDHTSRSCEKPCRILDESYHPVIYFARSRLWRSTTAGIIVPCLGKSSYITRILTYLGVPPGYQSWRFRAGLTEAEE